MTKTPQEQFIKHLKEQWFACDAMESDARTEKREIEGLLRRRGIAMPKPRSQVKKEHSDRMKAVHAKKKAQGKKRGPKPKTTKSGRKIPVKKTEQQKKAIVKEVRAYIDAGLTAPNAAKKAGISFSSYDRWKRL